MIVKQSTVGMAFDVNQPLTGAQAAEFKAAGFGAVIRYIPRTSALTKGNLTAPEIAAIIGAGLSLSVVQHVSPDNWQPNEELGANYGGYASAYCNHIGLPEGVNVWLDLEMVNPASQPQDIIDYCTEWYDWVHGGGYEPGLYVGWQTGLSPAQLYDLPFKSYWKGYNADVPIPKRGYQIIQSTQKTLNGITYDPNVVKKDLLGDSPIFLCP